MSDKMQEMIDSLNLVPVVSVRVRKELEEAGIVDEARLKVLLPVLKQSLQTSRIEDSENEFAITLVSTRDGKVLVKEDENGKDVPFTLKDWIEDFVFEPGTQFSQASGSVSYEESRTPSEEQLQDMASGKKVGLPPRKPKPEKGSIPASSLAARRKGNPSTEDVASGKVSVDMDR